jgi:hypothetical protein
MHLDRPRARRIDPNQRFSIFARCDGCIARPQRLADRMIPRPRASSRLRSSTRHRLSQPRGKWTQMTRSVKLACVFVPRSLESIGISILQQTPSDANARSTEPPGSCGMRLGMMLTLDLQLGEVATAGPPISRHDINSSSSPGPRFQFTSTRPCGVDSAPYFAAFVANSLSTNRQRLGHRDGERDIRAAERSVCVRSVGHKLTTDEFGEVDAVRAILAEQRVGIGH